MTVDDSLLPYVAEFMEFEEFVRNYGRFVINGFEVTSPDSKITLGWALYLNISVIDHSCSPNAKVAFRGNILYLLSLEERYNVGNNEFELTLKRMVLAVCRKKTLKSRETSRYRTSCWKSSTRFTSDGNASNTSISSTAFAHDVPGNLR